jgi:hypothetical protein
MFKLPFMMQPGIFNRVLISALLAFILVCSFSSITHAQTACSASSVTTDSCYEHACTGQSSEDSPSCNAYAASVVNRDDGGDATCVSITTSNEGTCCPDDGSDLSPMCVAYNDYTPADVQDANGGAAATTPNAIATPSIVSPDGDGLIPCDGNDCTINSVMQLVNNLMNFFFTTLLLPIFVVMVMYLGYSYLTANGSPGQHAKVASMAKHMFLGLLLMLCAFLIVHTILSILGYSDTFGFFG